MPILVGLGCLPTVRRVLELGAGQYSTTTFLNRGIFPHLDCLHSYETDRLWSERLAPLTKQDDRLTLTLIDKSIADVITTIDFSAYDLVFVDDSQDGITRAATIASVASYRAPANIIVIHDFEYQGYRQASVAIPHRYRFNAYNPETGVLWEHAKMDRVRLKRWAALVKQHAERGAPHDTGRWATLLSEHPEVWPE